MPPRGFAARFKALTERKIGVFKARSLLQNALMARTGARKFFSRAKKNQQKKKQQRNGA